MKRLIKWLAGGAWWLVGAALLLGSCAVVQQLKPREGQEAAVWIVWRSYGRTDTPPVIRWMEGEALNCTDPNSGNPGFNTPGLGCREGRTLSPVAVACAWTGQASFADTTLAHELMHAAQWRAGIFDPNHTTGPFQPGGLVERANALLVEAGR